MKFLIQGPKQWLLLYCYPDEENEHPFIVGVFAREEDARSCAQNAFKRMLRWSDHVDTSTKGVGFAYADIPDEAKDADDPPYAEVVLERVRTFPGGYRES